MLNYWLNYKLNSRTRPPDGPGKGSAVRGGKHSVCVCVCVCVWYVSTLTLGGPDLRSSQIAIIVSQLQLACGLESTSVSRQSWWFYIALGELNNYNNSCRTQVDDQEEPTGHNAVA